MTARPAITFAPAGVRMVLVGLGVVLLAQALRTLRAGRRHPAARHDALRVGSALVWCSVRVTRHTGALRRRSDIDVLATRLALAPRAWPARAIATTAHHSDAAVDLPDAVAGVRLLSAASLGAVTGASFIPLGPVAALTAGALGAVAGAWLPDLVLAHAARRSLCAGRRDITRAIDVLAASTSAGHSLQEALELTAGQSPPAVAAALRGAAVRLSTGVDPAAALAAESDRLGVPVLADVGEAADRQARLGIPLGPELRHIAARHRARERADLLARAARRGPLGTLIVALVIAPVCIAALTACLVGGLLESGGLGLH